MSKSKFLVRIVRVDGQDIDLRPNGHAERDLQAAVVAKLSQRLTAKIVEVLPSKGVGIFRTTKHVLADVESVVRVEVEKAITTALAEAIDELKSDVLPVI
jgi:hypothetical protein